MTLTIEIPDDTAARAGAIAAAQGQDLGTFAVALISGAVAPEAVAPASSRRPLMGFARVGIGRPDGTSEDIDGYIRTIRDEQDGRESQRKPLPWDEFLAIMTEGIDPNLPPLSDYAISREGIYEDHL